MGRGRSNEWEDEPLTPAGRLFAQPEMRQIIHCVVGTKNPFDIDSVKSELRKSAMLQHPRFTSLLVRDRRGREHWRPTQVDIERHVLIIDRPLSDADHDSAVNSYLADLSTEGLSMEKPLWELHILMAHNCAIFRIHHSLGDGISLMSMLLACCRKLHDPHSVPTIASSSSSSSSRSRNTTWPNILWNLAVTLWFCLVFALEFILRCLCVRDRKTPLSGGAGVELWPRKIATASFSLQDMKTVKTAVPTATINDVLFAVISSGISRYLDFRAPNGVQEGIQLTGLAMVNLRKQPGLQELSNLMKSNSGARWGNKFGMLLLPVYYHRSNNSDPLAYLKRAKAMIDRKKQSLEAHFSYKVGDLVMSTLGPKFASWLNYRILCNTTFTISNVVGPQEEIMMVENPVTYLRANNSALPHALILNMVSYAGRADMQVQVAKDIIPDPEFLAKCFEDALLEMKEQVTAKI
ncbi:wax ester synthase/diacylglycerol acyltransferase 11-like [Arachis stenosperma]|uniref:wax ester synthase/diacylglycerol acyltransferase 11-like n=1 Tax=Arachis stenosperma TaxID=217475 RepID=UPI0025AC3D2F|nr:wax ester synthase/diacylglycerol acyltransferase 11-like [Arachis stenosperma]XP_057762413.1 wax ester synthase/diacylglycerol acyltransferase 11-like [Arachis stenosperma]